MLLSHYTVAEGRVSPAVCAPTSYGNSPAATSAMTPQSWQPYADAPDFLPLNARKKTPIEEPPADREDDVYAPDEVDEADIDDEEIDEEEDEESAELEEG